MIPVAWHFSPKYVCCDLGNLAVDQQWQEMIGQAAESEMDTHWGFIRLQLLFEHKPHGFSIEISSV